MGNDISQLGRDCIAVQIPSGKEMVLPMGTDFHITQTLGGSYTIQTLQGLFRISRKEADALGITIDSPSLAEVVADHGTKAGSTLDEATVLETLRTVFDPEIPVNIVDLGLVYGVELLEMAPGSYKVDIKMTLTAPGCGMGGVIARDAQEKLLYLPMIEEAQVEVVWEPPWHHSMITPEGKKRLGLE